MNPKQKRSRKTAPGRKPVTYSELSPDELDRIAAPFEKELIPTKPLTRSMLAEERRARRKRGRPVVGEGAEKVLVSIEKNLLRQTDAYAKRYKTNRSQVIVKGLRAILFPERHRKAS